jgi:hypothetical protein
LPDIARLADRATHPYGTFKLPVLLNIIFHDTSMSAKEEKVCRQYYPYPKDAEKF